MYWKSWNILFIKLVFTFPLQKPEDLGRMSTVGCSSMLRHIWVSTQALSVWIVLLRQLSQYSQLKLEEDSMHCRRHRAQFSCLVHYETWKYTVCGFHLLFWKDTGLLWVLCHIYQLCANFSDVKEHEKWHWTCTSQKPIQASSSWSANAF